MTVAELFGTLQDSVTVQWRKHLQSGSHTEHVIIDEYYKKMPELIDALIEAYQADHDVIEDYDNLMDMGEGRTALSYLRELKDIVKEGRELFEGETELESLTDDILALIDTTIYKLDKLFDEVGSFVKEGHKKSLRDFLTEALALGVDMCSAKLRKDLDAEGLKDIELLQNDNGFYLWSANRKWQKILEKSKYNFIDVREYTDYTDAQWFDAINEIIKTLG